jgi:hypothetical protein
MIVIRRRDITDLHHADILVVHQPIIGRVRDITAHLQPITATERYTVALRIRGEAALATQ